MWINAESERATVGRSRFNVLFSNAANTCSAFHPPSHQHQRTEHMCSESQEKFHTTKHESRQCTHTLIYPPYERHGSRMYATTAASNTYTHSHAFSSPDRLTAVPSSPWNGCYVLCLFYILPDYITHLEASKPVRFGRIQIAVVYCGETALCASALCTMKHRRNLHAMEFFCWFFAPLLVRRRRVLCCQEIRNKLGFRFALFQFVLSTKAELPPHLPAAAGASCAVRNSKVSNSFRTNNKNECGGRRRRRINGYIITGVVIYAPRLCLPGHKHKTEAKCRERKTVVEKKLSNNFSLEPLDFSSFHFRPYGRSENDDDDDDGGDGEEFFVHLHFEVQKVRAHTCTETYQARQPSESGFEF